MTLAMEVGMTGRGHLGPVIREARRTRGWTQIDLATRMYCSPATVSRWETGRSPLTDIETLSRLAEVLEIPPRALGVATTVSDNPTAEDDPVRRRQLLQALAVTAAATAVPGTQGARAAQATPDDLLVANLRDALLAPQGSAAVSRSALAAAFTQAKHAFQACRYEQLAMDLPRLIAGGTTLAESGTPADCTLQAEILTLTARMLVKVDRTDLGLLAADRARQSAEGSADPIVPAEAARNLSVLTRKAGWHDRAAEIALSAADDPRLRGDDHTLKAQRGLLIMSAAYTAAKSKDRSGMDDLTAHAQSLANGLGKGVQLQHGTGFGTWMVESHLISGHNACGDPYRALRVARRLDPRALPTIERRSRYYTDVATSWSMVGNRNRCLNALLAAERQAPEETHARPAIHRLVRGLLTSGPTSPELRTLAARCGIT
jgi:transcriptional regulator with XRE-family HTH domain